MDRFDIPGVAVGLIEDGDVAWTNAYGYADLDSGRRMTTDTVCRAESITKSITAWGIMRLVEIGTVGLDDPVTDHVTSWELPDAEFSWEEVTIRRLLSNTAGLPDGIYSNYSLDDPVPTLTGALDGDAGAPAARPTDRPGSEFRYSNPGFVLLELVIEDATGRAYDEFIEAEVLEPLGMDGATFDASAVPADRLATNYTRTGRAVSPYREPARAHGMLLSTIEAIASFVAASASGSEHTPLGGNVLGADRVRTMHEPEIETTGFYRHGSDSYGLGHMIEELSNGERAVSHGGQGSGSWSWYHVVPETGDGIVVLTNSERSLRLIASILGDWTTATGLGSVSLSRTYTRVETAIRAITGIIGVAALGLAGYSSIELRSGSRTISPLASESMRFRLAVLAIAVGVLGGWWIVAYPTVDLLVPGLADWLGGAVTLFACALGVLAITPRADPEPRSDLATDR